MEYSLGPGSGSVGGSGGSPDGSSDREVSSQVSEKGASGKAIVDTGPLTMGVDAMEVTSAAERSLT